MGAGLQGAGTGTGELQGSVFRMQSGFKLEAQVSARQERSLVFLSGVVSWFSVISLAVTE